MAVAATELEPVHYISADEIPYLAAARQEVRTEAEQVINNREAQLQSGNYEGLPLSVDALSTAEKVIAIRTIYGEQSPEYEEAYGGLVLDSFRLLAEWRRKYTSEYFPKVRQTHDEVSGEFFSHGMSIWGMTGDGLTPASHPEETDRRVNERVEEGTAMAVRRMGRFALGRTVTIRTVSECTDWTIKALSDGATSGFAGYVPEIEKLMVRDMVFDTESNDRFEEQMAVPGTYLKHEVITEALRRRDMDAEDLTKTGLHGTQMLVDDDLIDFIELLDTVGSEMHGVDLFIGEVVSPGTVKDYASIRETAIARQEALKDYAHTVAGFVMDLKEQGTDPEMAPAIVEEFVKKILVNMADKDHTIVTDMFDEATATGLKEVAHLRSIGNLEEAYIRLNEVETAAPGGGYCGADSCGLERIKSGSKEEKIVEELGFDPENTIADRGDRTCKKCKSKTVVYELKQAKKGCTTCKATTDYK